MEYSYEIRVMNAGDVPAVAGIEAECFTNPWSENAFSEELRNPLAHTLVAVAEGAAVAFVNARVILDEVYINNVAVTVAHRGKGIGEALLIAFERSLPEQAQFITLEVRAGNTAAFRLYRKLKYVQVGIRRNFYTDPPEDALLMTKYTKND
ncbi:MAG: ribosomal protein S18-alanine N-acetyltransferase [Oscillospiraceae bacterium]